MSPAQAKMLRWLANEAQDGGAWLRGPNRRVGFNLERMGMVQYDGGSYFSITDAGREWAENNP